MFRLPASLVLLMGGACPIAGELHVQNHRLADTWGWGMRFEMEVGVRREGLLNSMEGRRYPPTFHRH